MREHRFRETIRVRLSAQLHARLEETAAGEGRTHSEIVRQALRENFADEREDSR
jgi:predicted DNA-binding protein